jgi:putative ABC transport system permease protein
LRLAWRLALRDLRAGGRGLWLLGLCLFLGTAALAGIGSLSASILAALDAQGRIALGGDLQMRVSQRRATVAELAAFAEKGRVSEGLTLTAMAQRDGGLPTMIELRGVDQLWPLVGRFSLKPGALADRPRGLSAAIGPALAERLNLRVGDSVRIGMARLKVIGLIATEPDQLGQGFRMGPPVIIDMAGLEATGLIQPGSLFISRYRINLPPGSDGTTVGKGLRDRFPNLGWMVRTPEDATRTLRSTIDQLGQFLLLVGLSALTIAGMGVGSGVGAYLGAKARMVAMLKVLGARSGLIATIFVSELGLVAAGAIALGLALGMAVPAIVAWIAGDALPLPPQLGIYQVPLLVAAALGLIVALTFALPALARARAVPAATLLRDVLMPRRLPSLRVLAAMALLVTVLITLAVLTATDRKLALQFLGATAALLAGLALLGWLLRRGVALIHRPRRPLLRLALTNLYRPGAQTDGLVVALGLGFSLFVALVTINSSLESEMRDAAPAKAPRFFALDLQPDDRPAFEAAVTRAAPGTRMEFAPSFRGTIVALNGRRILDMHPPPDSWLLRSDRTLTWSAKLPPRNHVVAGQWWPPDYRGPPLVAIGEDVARSLGLKLGDGMVISVLGVDVPVRVAAIRRIDWSALGMNFAIIFSPGYIEEAPHSLLATVYSPDGRDGAVAASVGAVVPSVSLLRTGDVIGQLNDIIGKIALAIRIAAAVTVAAGTAVLVGAVAASGRARRYDAVILKLLGANRAQVLGAQAIEYLLLSLLLALVALGVGGGAGWYVTTQIFELAFTPDWAVVALTLLGATAVTMAIGIAGSLSALTARPTTVLRAL